MPFLPPNQQCQSTGGPIECQVCMTGHSNIYCIVSYCKEMKNKEQQNRLWWYGLCCEKKTKCKEYEWRVPDQEVDQRGLRERLCKKDHQARKLNREYAVDRSRWRKLIKDGWWSVIGVSGWMFLLVPSHPSSPRQRAIKWLLLCIVLYAEWHACQWLWLCYHINIFFHVKDHRWEGKKWILISK